MGTVNISFKPIGQLGQFGGQLGTLNNCFVINIIKFYFLIS
jgi:hypothetical protein